MLLLLPLAADRASFPADAFAFDLDLGLPCGGAYVGHVGCAVVLKQSVQV